MSNFLISQIFGIIALLFLIVSYFINNKLVFLIMQLIVNAFYAVSLLFVDATVAGIVTFIAILRLIFLSLGEKYNIKHTSRYLILFVIAFIITTIVFWSNWTDLMPLTTVIIYTFAYGIKDMQKMRITLIIPSIILIIYCIIVTAYTDALLDVLGVTVLIVSIIKFNIEQKASKKIEKDDKNILKY